MSLTINKKAWGYLSHDEKSALTIQHGLGKSSWEVGEIMNKSHYKYLEIKYRGEHYLKIFTEQVELFDCLVSDQTSGDKMVIRYFKLCIEKRKKPMQAMEVLIDEHGKITKGILNEKIIQTIKKWSKDDNDNAFDKNLYNLVMDFDRWNNFRILPKEIQEPSAFKRRIKNAYKKQIRAVKGIHPIAIEKLKKLYQTKNSPFVYVPLITEIPEIYKFKENKGSMSIFNGLGLYVFKDKEKALSYINEIYKYLSKGKKECTDGLDFWPIYRELIKFACNYHTVMQISSSRKYLQLAQEKFQLI